MIRLLGHHDIVMFWRNALQQTEVWMAVQTREDARVC
jgi:hypothetical protein